METLREDHRNMTRLLAVMEGQIESIRSDEEPDYMLLTEAANYCLTYPDLYHHPKEDQVYRRLVEKGVSPDQVGDMENEHQDLKGLIHRLAVTLDSARKTGDLHRETLASLIESFVQTYRLHMDAEDRIFFPLAEELLEAADWEAIDAEMSRMTDPLFGDRSVIEYHGLSRALF
jgi:hemerythrin-like domain-containing protein